MEGLTNYFNDVIKLHLVEILISIVIIIVFNVISSIVATIIIKIFRIGKSKKENKEDERPIKESALYRPIKILMSISGIYVAILYLQNPLQISVEVINGVNVIYKAISVISFVIALAESFKPESMLIKRIKAKREDENDLMFDFGIKVARICIYIIGFFVLIIVLGFDITGLIAGLGVSGVILTLAAQDTAKSLFGGAMIFLDKPFKVGDWIQLEGYEGVVEDITFRSTRIRTFENSIVNIPNANVANVSITNWSKMQKRRYKTNLCIELETPLQKLENFKEKIEAMLCNRKSIIDDSVIVKFDVIKQNGLNVLIYSFVDALDYIGFLEEKEEINYLIMNILKEEGIKLAYDTKTIKLEEKIKIN